MDMFELVLSKIMEHSQTICILEIYFDKIELNSYAVLDLNIVLLIISFKLRNNFHEVLALCQVLF